MKDKSNDTPPPHPQMAVTRPFIERLQNAVEGECDGLMIDDRQAEEILAYVFYGEALSDNDDLPQVPWPASDWAIDRIKTLEAALTVENLRKAEAEAFKRGFEGGVRNAAESTVHRLRYALQNCVNVMKRCNRPGAENQLTIAWLIDAIRAAEMALDSPFNWSPPPAKRE